MISLFVRLSGMLLHFPSHLHGSAKIQPIFFGMGANGLFNSNNVVTIQAEEYITILGDQRYRDKPITTHMNANTVNCIHQSEHAHIVIAHCPDARMSNQWQHGGHDSLAVSANCTPYMVVIGDIATSVL